MDAKKFVEALNQGEAQEALSYVPTELLLQEIHRRGYEVPQAIGKTAVISSQNTENSKDEPFESRIGAFLDTDRHLEVADQLSIMEELWSRLGFTTPKLSEDEQAQLTKLLGAYPTSYRILPAPLLSHTERLRLLRTTSDASLGGLYMETLQALEQDAEITIRKRSMMCGIRYRSLDGQLVDHQTHVNGLVKADHAIVKDDVAWIFPILDIRLDTHRYLKSIQEKYRLMNPIVATESLIGLHLLYQLNGTQDQRDKLLTRRVDLANEAVYRLDPGGKPPQLIQVVGVNQSKDGRLRVAPLTISAERPAWDRWFDYRGAVSGL